METMATATNNNPLHFTGEVPILGLKTCKSCRFYRERQNGEMGDCRRYPPSLTFDFTRKSYMSGFPIVPPAEWCGEHQT